ncbi:cytochrome P450 [Boletus edulis BED1]|uniref:Cytochrome P450 n=1 Tax=Boletus edulis BED1 TaxID=1328754 RepID=A0AAD4C382_BOLED|nr:cytochrome P450 [Boletus edulis BED1]
MPPLDSHRVTLSLVCIAVVLLGHWVYVQCVAARKGLPIPPGPSGRWFLGTPFPKSRAAFKFAELTKKYGPVFSLRHGPTLFVIIGGHQAAMEIMEKEGASLADRPRSIAAGETLSGGLRIITSRSGDRLRRLRRVMHAVMQPKVAATYEPIQLRHAKNMLLDILDDPESHQMHTRGFAASTVMEIIYGKTTPTSYNDPEVIAANRCIMRFGQAMTPKVYLVDTYPILRYVPGYLTQLRTWHQEELALFEGQLDVVRKQMAEGKARPCFATFLIEKQREYQILDKDMAYLAGGMFGAGSETTASAITIMIMAAALHPDAQATVQEELDRVVGSERLPSFADQEMLPRVTAFILETLRWRPVTALGFAHRATKDIVWRDFVIPEGATVIGNHWAIANDPDVFPNPEKFDPQRWLTAEGTLRDDLRFSAFGFGRRICPGQHIANRSIFTSVALILWAFRLSEDPTAPIDSFGFSDTVLQIADLFRVTFKPRTSEAQIRYLCHQMT